MIAWRYVTPEYFAALGIRIFEGRGFSEQDRGPGDERVILSETLARKLFPDGDPVGKRFIAGFPHSIVGVARDVHNSGPAGPSSPEYYVLRKHSTDGTFRNQPAPDGWRSAKVVLRTSVSPKIVSGWVAKEFAELDPQLPVTVTSMQQRVGRLAQRPRFNALLLAMFAGMGLLLACIGLYGVMAFLIAQRTQEIGVRMALGATPSAVMKMILSRAALWTSAGAVFGLAGAFFATRALRTMLFQVREHDLLTSTLALLSLCVIALAAAWIPSRKAARVDPMTALRHE